MVQFQLIAYDALTQFCLFIWPNNKHSVLNIFSSYKIYGALSDIF